MKKKITDMFHGLYLHYLIMIFMKQMENVILGREKIDGNIFDDFYFLFYFLFPGPHFNLSTK